MCENVSAMSSWLWIFCYSDDPVSRQQAVTDVQWNSILRDQHSDVVQLPGTGQQLSNR